ncbi:MAG TPA: hypothetical protein H9853_04365 [Candidatus Sphingobacterium stercoripullorum]|uniref:DUF3106 domain-containing protein n=1 Tax=Candidatus Sphingobacterium stercoripullorum TaxID=2838759 RepID=A0A9D2AYV7_9SPHI|nr:hypothetical protein [Candidatus Sphingobacterium stercoripullorum]
MKKLFYSLILISTLAFTDTALAQETDKNTQISETEIKEKIRKWIRYQDPYLLTLTDEERKELFYHRWKGKNVTPQTRETDVKYDEQRFQRAKEKYDNMTDVQRDSILTVYKKTR